MNHLIVTADDFGLHAAVNEAVERAARDGVLTAASLMVAAPAAADAIRRARALPGLRVGLHLDAGGRFGDRMSLDGLRFALVPAARRALEAGIREQFAAFAASGLDLDHVNVHRHFHLHPVVLEIVLKAGAEFGLPAVRVPAEPWWMARGVGGLSGMAGAAALTPWLALMKRRLTSAGVPYNDHVFGIAASGRMHESRLIEILTRLPSGVTEIYLHPATVSSAAVAPSMAAYAHAEELAALLSPRVRAAVEAAGASLGGYRDFVRPARAASGAGAPVCIGSGP